MGGYNEKVLVSVIIPVYGVEKYIAQCLESVVNDGTRDRRMKLARNSYSVYCMRKDIIWYIYYKR